MTEKIEPNKKDSLEKLSIEEERMKNLFPEKKKHTVPVSEHTGWRKVFEDSKYNGVLDKVVWSGTALIAAIGIGLFFYSKKLDKEMENEKVAIARYIGDFIITEQSGPKPFVVSLRDAKSLEEFKAIKIANDCKLFDKKSYVGEKMNLIKFTIVNVNDENDKTYFFKGINERICDGQSFTPDSSNSFYVD